MTGDKMAGDENFSPRILVFSTNNISDPGIDLAGSSQMHYPPSAMPINMPCSSGIKPGWILYAIDKGFDGVFIAADGMECVYLPDCGDRTAKIVADAQALLQGQGYKPERIKMAAICSVCAESFANYMRDFYGTLKKLGPVKKGEQKSGL
jgi:F420-non-reducing hydrogenase iron-sulfur subunit